MQNLTSRFNIIHHGRSILSDAEKRIREAHIENYQHLLPPLIEPTELSASRDAALMDSVIGKAQRVVNEKNRSRFVEEAYFLMGRANYLKRNFHLATELFSYVAETAEFEPRIKQQARIWQARSLMQLGSLHAAGEILDSVMAGVELDRRSRAMAYATRATYHLLRNEDRPAITAVAEAINSRGRTADKIRWHFLLAQLLERNNYRPDAIRHYRRVARSNVNYEMAFQAALNRVFLEARAHPNEERQLRAFHRMIRDDKNNEFRDQLYYYLGETHAHYHRPEVAVDYFNRSLLVGSTNLYQKTTTYLRLGDHFFEQQQYGIARSYYDSTAMVMPIDYPDGEPIRRRLAHVGELIDQLQVVARQDSLVQLAALDDSARREAVDRIIRERYAKAVQDYEKAHHSPSVRGGNSAPQVVSPFDQTIPDEHAQAYADNRFYFNNPDAVGMGVNAFRRRWGNRQLEDNWRWSQDRSGLGRPSDIPLSGEGRMERGESPSTTQIGPATSSLPDSLEFAKGLQQEYASLIPTDPASMEAAEEKALNALEEIGELYRFGFRDHNAAAEVYLELLKRAPRHTKRAAWLYQLVLLSGEDENAGPQSFRQALLREFPESIYSKILQNPQYLQGIEEKKKQLSERYHAVYNLYLEANYDGVIRMVDDLLHSSALATEEISGATGGAQFAYLRALAIGRSAEPVHFEQALKALIEQYAGDQLVTPLAKQHLEFMQQHAEEIYARPFALLGVENQESAFVDEPTLTRWPQLVIRSHVSPEPRNEEQVTDPIDRTEPVETVSIPLPTPTPAPALPTGTSRNKELLPDSATYYFVVNVLHPRVNLAPSRFGIGQFNRTRYADRSISHQLKQISDQSQLLYVGPFANYREAKQYETMLLPLLPDIMKIPAEVYNSFIITETKFGTLSEFDQVDEYELFYRDQKSLK